MNNKMTTELLQDMTGTSFPVGKQAFGGDDLFDDDGSPCVPKVRSCWVVDVQLLFFGSNNLHSESWRIGGSEKYDRSQVIEQVKRRAEEYTGHPAGKKLKTCYITGYHGPCLQEDIERYKKTGVLVVPNV